MRKRLRRKQSRNGLRADATVANIKEEENTSRKTLRNLTASYMLTGE